MTLRHARNLTPLLLLVLVLLQPQPSNAKLYNKRKAVQCEPWTVPPEERCTYIKANADVCSNDGYIDYLHVHYCQLDGNDVLTATLFIGWILVLFGYMLTVAERFFCPSLELISEYFKLPPTVAGATLLAFGNGAPDVFTQLAAVGNDGPADVSPEDISVAMSEPLGSGQFIGNIVLAIVILASSSSKVLVQERYFLKDVGFYLVAVACVFACLLDGKIYFWECVSLAMLYVAYVVVTVASARDDSPVMADPALHEVPHEPWYLSLFNDASLMASSMSMGSLSMLGLAPECQVVLAVGVDGAPAGHTSTSIWGSKIRNKKNLTSPTSCNANPAKREDRGTASQTHPPSGGDAQDSQGKGGRLARILPSIFQKVGGEVGSKTTRASKGTSPKGPAIGAGYGGAVPPPPPPPASSAFVPKKKVGGGRTVSRFPPAIVEPLLPYNWDEMLMGQVSAIDAKMDNGSTAGQRQSTTAPVICKNSSKPTCSSDCVRADSLTKAIDFSGGGLGVAADALTPPDSPTRGTSLAFAFGSPCGDALASNLDDDGHIFPLDPSGVGDAPAGASKLRVSISRDQLDTQGKVKGKGKGKRHHHGGDAREANLPFHKAFWRRVEVPLLWSLSLVLPRVDGPHFAKYSRSNAAFLAACLAPAAAAAYLLGKNALPPPYPPFSPIQSLGFNADPTPPDAAGGVGTSSFFHALSAARSAGVHYPMSVFSVLLPTRATQLLQSSSASSTGSSNVDVDAPLGSNLGHDQLGNYMSLRQFAVFWDSPLWYCSLLASLVAVMLVYAYYPRKGKLRGKALGLCTVVAFLGAIRLVDLFANELVNTALAAGILLGVSPSLLSVTLLAWGNSISDLVSNISLAQDGYPTMAVTACFASPLFVLLGGLVLSMAKVTLSGPLTLPTDTSLKVLYGSSLAILVAWALLVPLVFKFKLGRKVSYIAIGMYLISQSLYVFMALREQ